MGRAPGFARRVVGAFDTVWAQSDADAGRLRALGGRDVSSPGNLKFAAAPLPADTADTRPAGVAAGGRPRWLAASTHPGEEAIAAAVHRRLLPTHPGLLTAIAPRHPDRGPALAAELGAARRGAGEDPPPGGLWIADGLGEMGLLYRLFPSVFVGKSLSADGGGQNPLEPARFGCALAAGPAMANQAEAARGAVPGRGARHRGGRGCTGGLGGCRAPRSGRPVRRGPGRPAGCRGRCRPASARCRRFAGDGRLMRAPAFWQSDGVLPRLLSPLAALVAGATARRVAQPGWRAPVPVVCCGNAGVGGAGKTTLALDLGARLQRRGAAVAFLTRGYGGRVRGTARVGDGDDAAEMGDEALLLAAVAPTFVGPDRAAGARAAVADGATVLVMDDGLQNPGLVKDLAFLVIDGAAGFGNGRVLPAGRCGSRCPRPRCAAGRRC